MCCPTLILDVFHQGISSLFDVLCTFLCYILIVVIVSLNVSIVIYSTSVLKYVDNSGLFIFLTRTCLSVTPLSPI